MHAHASDEPLPGIQFAFTPPRFQNFVMLVYLRVPLPTVGLERVSDRAGTGIRRTSKFTGNRWSKG